MTSNRIFAAALVAFAVVGCARKNGPATDEHGHDHEGESLQLTAYSPDFEVYAEATPFVVGRSGEILAHFTHLENFKPLAGGSVTASLTVGTDGVSQTLAEPARPGIYIFSLTPDAEGEARLTFDVATPGGTSRIEVGGITVYSDEHEAEHEAAEAAVGGANGAVFTKEQSWKVDFATEQARTEPFGGIIKTTARILPSQGDERIVTAKTGGIVTFSEAEIVEGSAVAAGQSLFTIAPDGMAEGNLSVRWAEVEGEYNRAKAEWERKAELAKDDIVSQSDLLAAKTAYTAAEAAYNNLRSNFSAGRQSVSSPVGGFVTRMPVTGGQYVAAGETVLVVSRNRDLFIRADVQPRWFDMLSGIVSANFRPMTGDRTYTLEELGGSVVSYGRSIDTASPLIPVVFRVNNTVGLLPGSFVEMYITTRTDARAVTVPTGAIVEEMGRYFVYVQSTPEFFEKRAVDIGATDGLRVQITEGLAAGERVVSRGAILVKLAQASGTLDAHSGHVH